MHHTHSNLLKRITPVIFIVLIFFFPDKKNISLCALKEVSGLWWQPSIHCVPVNQVNKVFFFFKLLGWATPPQLGFTVGSAEWTEMSVKSSIAQSSAIPVMLFYPCVFNLLSTIPKERSWGDDIKVWVTTAQSCSAGWFDFVHVCLGFGKERHFSLALFFSYMLL